MSGFDDRALAALPATIAEVAEALGIPVNSARTVLHGLRRKHLAHISSWIANSNGGYPAQVWSSGGAEDAIRPVKPKNSARSGDWATCATATTILCHLESGRVSVKQAAFAAGVNEDAARKLLKQMHRDGIVHIGAWISSLGAGGHPTMMFELGPGKDAKKPKPLTMRENWNRWANGIRAKYGNEIAGKILRSRRNGGAETMVVGGVEYRRGGVPA